MSNYHDLLNHPLEVGDKVAYPTGTGSDKRMCVAEIIGFTDYQVRRVGRKYNEETGEYDRQPYMHDKWKVRLQPLRWNDYRSTYGYVDGKYTRDAKKPKRVTVENVFNLVKVEFPDGE